MLNIVSKKFYQPAISCALNSSSKRVDNELKKILLIQSRNICHKHDIDPDHLAMRLPPFDYKNKSYTWLQRYLKSEGYHGTLGKFTENTKIVVVEGNVGSGKHELAKKLADDLGMAYFPDVNAEMDYVFEEDGFDLRSINPYLHEDVKLPDFRSVLETRNPFQAGYWEIAMFRMRCYNYLAAMTHMLHTGDGVVLERSPWSGTVFARAGQDIGLLSQTYLDHYWEVRSNAFSTMHRPHIIIYLDVPVDECLKNAKTKNTHNTGELLTEEYLESVEKNYKKHFLPIIEEHAEIFTYKLTKPVTEETATELSELIVDELSESEMDENFMRICNRSDKFDDWRFYDNDLRWSDLRWETTKNKYRTRLAFDFYPYYVDELWPAYSLIYARMHVFYNALEERDKKLRAAESFKHRLLGKKETYDQRDKKTWFMCTGYRPDHLLASE